MEKKYFKIYTHNVVVKGNDKAVMYDLQHGKLHPIPLVLCSLLNDLNRLNLKEIANKYTPSNPEILNKYIHFFLENNLGFFTNNPDLFPEIDMSWDSPSLIQNAIFEYNFQNYDFQNCIQQLNELNCKQLELRLSTSNPKEPIIECITYLENTSLSSVQLIIPYHKTLSLSFINELAEITTKLTSIIIYNTPTNFNTTGAVFNSYFVNEDFRTTEFAKPFSHKKYIVNLSYFTESQKYNTYYNRKLCVDFKGNIKNCLRHDVSFGNVNESSILSVITKNTFQELWNAHVDKIHELKNSAYRYALFVSNSLKKQPDGFYSLV